MFLGKSSPNMWGVQSPRKTELTSGTFLGSFGGSMSCWWGWLVLGLLNGNADDVLATSHTLHHTGLVDRIQLLNPPFHHPSLVTCLRMTPWAFANNLDAFPFTPSKAVYQKLNPSLCSTRFHPSVAEQTCPGSVMSGYNKKLPCPRAVMPHSAESCDLIT